jgi:hypothetical protein
VHGVTLRAIDTAKDALHGAKIHTDADELTVSAARPVCTKDARLVPNLLPRSDELGRDNARLRGSWKPYYRCMEYCGSGHDQSSFSVGRIDVSFSIELFVVHRGKL